jgi:hypothetical protein
MNLQSNDDLEEGECLEVISFADRGIRLRGTFISTDTFNNVTIELLNGTRSIFKKDNLQKVDE